MSKYGNRRFVSEDGTFDSLKEFRRWQELKLMPRAGVIHDLKRQVPFELIPAQKENGKVIERAVTYKADFTYTENGETVVEDVKGIRTKEYILKRKIMLWEFGIKIKEV